MYYSFFFSGKRVRLGGGSRPNEGYVEALASNGQWAGVCDNRDCTEKNVTNIFDRSSISVSFSPKLNKIYQII